MTTLYFDRLLFDVGFASGLVLEHGCDERRPACLVIGAKSSPRVRMKVLVKQYQVFPMEIVCVFLIRAVTRLRALLIFLEKQDQSAFDFVCNLT